MESLTASMAGATVVEKKKLGLKPLAAKLPKNPSNQVVDVDTNIRKLVITKNQPIFKYSIKIEYFYRRLDGSECSVEFSRSTKNGTGHEEDKDRCQRVYLMAAKKFAAGDASQFFYDRQASLYTLKNLKIGQEGKAFEFKNDISKRANFLKATLTIKPVEDSFQATTNDITRCISSCPGLSDKTLLEAMNNIVSGPAINNPEVITIGSCVHYLFHPEQYGIQTHSYSAGERYSAVGATKAVKVMEGTDKQNPSLFLVTEIKDTLFHPDDKNLLDLFKTFQGFRTDMKANSPGAQNLLKACEGLDVYMDYGAGAEAQERMVVSIKGFGEPAAQCFFETPTGKTNVVKYFQQTYNLRIQHPNLFTIEAKGPKGGKMNLPVEFLVVCNSQKVTTSQMQKNEQKDMIKLSAAKPHDRRARTDQVVRAIGLGGKKINEFVDVEQPIRIKGVQLPYPKISFAGNQAAVLPNPSSKIPTDFNSAGKFLEAVALQSWELCYIQGQEVRGLKEALVQEMARCGMIVKQPDVTLIVNGDLRSVFQNAKDRKRQMLFFVIPERSELHQKIKALEQEFDVLTQEVKKETADKFFKQPQTRQNVVNKTNMKLGGLNYHITSPYFTPDLLIVGFETASRGGSGDGPVSVGFAANMMKHWQKYCGAYIFVPRSKDVFGPILKDTMIKIFQTARGNGRLKPSEIIVYFNGVTEGQYSMINEEYLPLIKAAWEQNTNGSQPPKITLIASSKTHNERLYKNERGQLSNLTAGTVVDHTIVNPVLNEFYLASCVARQGTTKTVKYTLISTDQEKQSMQRLETLTNDLCYDHQIIFHPVGLPVPLYIAGRNSQRGSVVLHESGARVKDGKIDYEKTNEELGYSKKALFGTRFNA
uniref:Piwi domain-containing protein n=1 Tax=Caenorhabditis tropicalis TaxID=1561998 RepID=A0A1I7UIK0_9PELO